jgi:hypothetical protein
MNSIHEAGRAPDTSPLREGINRFLGNEWLSIALLIRSC